VRETKEKRMKNRHLILIAIGLATSLAACSSAPVQTEQISNLPSLEPLTDELIEYKAQAVESAAVTWPNGKLLVGTDPTFDIEKGRGIVSDSQGNIFVAYQSTRIRYETQPFNIGIQAQNTVLKVLKLGANSTRQWQQTISQSGSNVVASDVTNETMGTYLATDASGNVIVTGRRHRAKLGGQVAEKIGPDGALVAKFNTNGVLQWQAFLDGSSDTGTTGVGTDAQGNVYITGFTCGNGFDFYSNKIRGACDQFLAKYSSGGARVWVRLFGGVFNDLAGGIAVDATGNSVIVGGRITSATAPYFPFDIREAALDAYAAKFNGNGDLVWDKTFATNKGDVASATAVDASGNVYVGGQTAGPLGGSTSIRTNASDGFLLKLNSSGAWLWTKQVSSNGLTDDCRASLDCGSVAGAYARTSGITLAQGQVYINGTGYNSRVDGNDVAWPLRYDSNGNFLGRLQSNTNSASFPSSGLGHAVATTSRGVFFLTWLFGGPFSDDRKAEFDQLFVYKLNFNLGL
jgi:hypothetical protein